MNTSSNIIRIWKYIDFNEMWSRADTSTLDDIAPSWFSRRKILQNNSDEYSSFIDQLKREHAIETGIIERLYDLKKGITETFIKEGFVQSFLSHGDTNVPTTELMGYLKDHLEAVDFVFDVVKEDRPLTKGFIKELHQLVTRNQDYAEGRDQFGNKTKIPLLKGTFKERENNPVREDGTLIYYCPPEHVDAEMDRLIELYIQLCEENIHPIIISSWLHHAFTTIHPFQDGNGRVARLIASLILIRFNFFPFTVLREEAKVKYIEGLEEADNGNPQKLVDYFAEIQKRNIEKALNIKEVTTTSLEEVTSIFKQKLRNWETKQQEEHEQLLSIRRMEVFTYCSSIMHDLKRNLLRDFAGTTSIVINYCPPDDFLKQHYYYNQIVQYANKHDYYFNRTLPKSWIIFRIILSDIKKYQLGITIHHYGYDNTTIAIGAFLEYKSVEEIDENENTTIPLEIQPHVISIQDDFSPKKKNTKLYLENVLTLTLAQIASEL